MSMKTISEKLKRLNRQYKDYVFWVNSFIKEPTRQKKMRIKEKARMFSNTKNTLNSEIQGTSCGWGKPDDPGTSKKNL